MIHKRKRHTMNLNHNDSNYMAQIFNSDESMFSWHTEKNATQL